jgi:hypothetical protein
VSPTGGISKFTIEHRSARQRITCARRSAGLSSHGRARTRGRVVGKHYRGEEDMNAPRLVMLLVPVGCPAHKPSGPTRFERATCTETSAQQP